MEYRKDLVPGILLALFSIVYIGLSFQIKIFEGLGSTPLTSRFIPRLWGGCLLILSIILILRGLNKYKKAKAVGKLSDVKNSTFTMSIKNNREVVLSFVLLAVYILGLQTIGFTVMSILYLFLGILILTPINKKKNYIVIAIVSVVFAVVIDFIFVVLLGVLLPKGILGF